MKKILLGTLISVSLFAFGLDIPKKKEYIDLGVEGAQYPIVEENFIIVLKDGVAELQKKLTKEYVKNKLIKEIRRNATAHTKLGICSKNNKSVELNEFIVKENIYNPAGRLYKKKGDKIVVKNKVPLDVCFITANTIQEADAQIEFYDKIVKKISGEQAECIYMVTDINVLQLDKKYYPRLFFPATKGYEESFNVSCYPTLIHLQGDKRYKFEIPLKDIVR